MKYFCRPHHNILIQRDNKNSIIVGYSNVLAKLHGKQAQRPLSEMTKTKIQLEYLLKPSSKYILWECISTAAGYGRWLADEVTVDGDHYTFVWGDETKRARLLTVRPFSHVRFRWDDDTTGKTYFEIRMKRNELTNEFVLEISDFADEEDKDNLIKLWDSEVYELKRIAGI